MLCRQAYYKLNDYAKKKIREGKLHSIAKNTHVSTNFSSCTCHVRERILSTATDQLQTIFISLYSSQVQLVSSKLY